MIAVILFFVVIVVFAIVFGMWGNSLDKKEKEIKKMDASIKERYDHLQTNLAHLQVREETTKKMADTLAEKAKTLEEASSEFEAMVEKRYQDFKDKEDELLKWEADLADRLADIEAKERSLGLTEVPDIIEPVEEPAKPVKKARKEGRSSMAIHAKRLRGESK